MARPRLLRALSVGLTGMLIAPAGVATAQTGTAAEPVRYVGGVFIDTAHHEGRLRPAIGVESRQVFRANRTRPELAEDFGWTYNHAPNLAYWNDRFYFQYLSNPVGEHIAPGQTLVATSVDGRNWEKPQVVFPPYELPEDGPAMMHQRMGFYAAPNGRLLVLGFHGRAPNPFGSGGVGRVVREAYPDGTYGPIYFIRYNSAHGWSEENTTLPFYRRSQDPGFIEACEALLANRLVTQQWWDEDRSEDGFYAVTGRIQALSFFRRKDGKVVGLWKWSLAALSSDNGESWSAPVEVPTILMDGAKIWGQRTKDGRYALVHNPINDTWRRYPLAIVTSDDGILFDDKLLVNGEVPPRRFQGKYKDWGQQYVRGIVEGNGNPPSEDMWVAYSMNKEDMWVSRIPLPVRSVVTDPVSDTFDGMRAGGVVVDWNIYSPRWAPVDVVEFPNAENKSLQLRDEDPYDYARAVRVFPESVTARLSWKVCARQNTTGRLEMEVMDRWAARPIRILYEEDGWIRTMNGAALVDLAPYEPDVWYTIGVAVDVPTGKFHLSIDGATVLSGADFTETVRSVERLSFRTGAYRNEPTRRMNPEPGPEDLPGADDPVPAAVFHVDDVTATPQPGDAAPPEIQPRR